MAEKQRQRGNASAAAKILQRDLGLAQQPAGRRRGRNTADPPKAQGELAATSQEDSKAGQPPASPAKKPTSTPAASAQKSQPAQPPNGPAAQRVLSKPSEQNSNTQPASGPQPKSTPQKVNVPSLNATQAFLKHANPSQGITEPLLSEAFTPFGALTKVEIDKKKGFAYVDFAEPESLKKAMAASPVKVAQGSVVVLERKTGQALQGRNQPQAANRGGSASAGRGGSPAPAPGPGPAPAAPATAGRGNAPPTAPSRRGGPNPRGGAPGAGRGGTRGDRGRRGGARGGGQAGGAAAAVTNPVPTQAAAPTTEQPKT